MNRRKKEKWLFPLKEQVCNIRSLLYVKSSDVQYHLSNPKFFGRMACLGIDVTGMLGLYTETFNIQKGRIDRLVESIESPKRRFSNFYEMLKLTFNHDVESGIFQHLVRQRSQIWMNFSPPKAIFFDTYSELTDQKFQVHRNQSLYCNYSDIHTNQFSVEDVSCEGLIDAKTMLKSFIKFNEWVLKNWGNVPIFILVFPLKKESREKFIDQNRMLLEVLDKCKERFSNISIIQLPEDYIFPPDDFTDDFRYHYSDHTKSVFAELLNKEMLKRLTI